MLSLEDLNTYLLYDPSDKTFPFIWKRRTVDSSGFNEQYAGTRAGCQTSQGYVHVSLDNTVYKLHRLVYMWGSNTPNFDLVPECIDHIDRDKTNNLFENLRDGNNNEMFTLNSRNRESSGASKYLGVSYSDKKRNKFCASIHVNKREIILVSYKDEITCAEVYKAACKFLGYDAPPEYTEVKDVSLAESIQQKLVKAINNVPPEHKNSEYSGVVWARDRQKYVATIHTYLKDKSKGENMRVGTYINPEEAAIRRDLVVLERGFSNKLNIVTQETYDYFKALYPPEKVKMLQATNKYTKEQTIYSSRLAVEHNLSIERKKLKGILEKSISNTTPWEFEYIYVDKVYS